MVILAGKVYSTCSYAGAHPGESGTGLIKVITLKPVTESTNKTNTWALQTWQVVGCCIVAVISSSCNKRHWRRPWPKRPLRVDSQ